MSKCYDEKKRIRIEEMCINYSKPRFIIDSMSYNSQIIVMIILCWAVAVFEILFCIF